MKIESNIPMPTAGASRESNLSVLRLMKVGDSVRLPTRRAKSLICSARQAKIKTSIRKINEEEHRVWRIA